MSTPASTSTSDLADALAARLQREPDVLVAYLFGSWARGEGGAVSDVDVAVLLGASPTLARYAALTAAVGEVTGSERADVVVLDDAPIPLAYRVLRDGRLLFSRDEGARVRHWVRTVDRYLDMAPLRAVLQEGTRRRLKEGRFGRP
ncbi:nucleotidyltransferase domain-containing protein [Egibacter rhizosphaerae]|uniref:Nucleotidyltransferase domain-containing protein n=1 Tax=Egibacter rhizosphaerae TaxID=1670831 RepID=A0A411YEN8_9ACTN|nr:nucleotidyltransferase domain-containing protein [Egibacter rhizosphaerae]QBI19723.1 nucleotidyltransferase domain-containing protein [Egibacter rhizosphaerae]